MTLRLEIVPYRLPLRRPWHSACGQIEERRGWLVIAAADGVRGYGDCAPLPEAGTEIPALAARRLDHWRGAMPDGSPAAAIEILLDTLDEAHPSPTPAADCALESALLDLAAHRAGLPLRHLLNAKAGDAVEVNAALGAVASATTDQLQVAVSRGYRTFKLKLGTSAPDLELDRVRTVAAALPDGALLRLDANGAWDRATAKSMIEALAGLPIDCVEEPLRDPTDSALAELQALATFAVGLDESLARRPQPVDPSRLPVRRLVLKPGVLGGLRPTLRLAQDTLAAGREVVLTGLVESAAGLWATAQLAAATGSPLAHGLATADWLVRDLGAPPQPVRGRIALPAAAGSGFVPASDGPLDTSHG